MSNATVSVGFVHIGYLPGYSPDFQQATAYVPSSNTTAIFRGDPVVIASGVIQPASNATAQVHAIFDGCEYSDSSGRFIFAPNCPASQTATARVINSPGALFKVQASATAIVTANINKNVGITLAAGSGSTVTGFGAYGIDQSLVATTATLPFRIVGLLSTFDPSAVNGTDNTTNNNIAIVTFNSQSFKAGQTGV